MKAIYVIAGAFVLAALVVAGLSTDWFGLTADETVETAYCGNEKCDVGENLASCARDCGVDTGNDPCDAESCGNGVCAGGCSETPTSCPSDCALPASPQTGQVLPVQLLVGICKNKFTMAAETTGTVNFYKVGADVADPNIARLDAFTCGGNTSSKIILTGSDYDVYYNGSSTYYDEKLGSWKISYNDETGTGSMKFAGDTYHASSPIGAFVDQNTLPSVQSGVVDTTTDTIAYNETQLGGSMWIQMDIGNSNSNSELDNVVLCFRDNDGDMEGTEVTALTASYVSGSTKISIPGNLLTYWKDAQGGAGPQCIKIADKLGASEKARWEFTFTVTEADFATTEEFEMSFDDLGGYLVKEYPSRDSKATVETLTIGDQD